tara:strand:+ start:199 stop:450 length:252 start_codon:yes stop_codon:yes gene_type:complete
MAYNGWTNYETWRVNLEVLSDGDYDEEVSAEYLEDLVEYLVFNESVDKNSLAYSFAKSFVSEVNFEQIANSINEELKINSQHV